MCPPQSPVLATAGWARYRCCRSNLCCWRMERCYIPTAHHTIHGRHRRAGERLPPLLKAHCSKLTAQSSLLKAHCSKLLRQAHCSKLTAQSSLLKAHCSKLTAHVATLLSWAGLGLSEHSIGPSTHCSRPPPSRCRNASLLGRSQALRALDWCLHSHLIGACTPT